MKTYNTYNKTFVHILITLLLISNISCMKKIAVQWNSSKIRAHDKICVHLHSGREFTLTYSRFEDNFLIGMNRDQEMKIPRSEIDSLTIVKPDKKRTLIGILIGTITLTTVTLLLYGSAFAEAPNGS